jgi:hypothetical protein
VRRVEEGGGGELRLLESRLLEERGVQDPGESQALEILIGVPVADQQEVAAKSRVRGEAQHFSIPGPEDDLPVSDLEALAQEPAGFQGEFSPSIRSGGVEADLDELVMIEEQDGPG